MAQKKRMYFPMATHFIDEETSTHTHTKEKALHLVGCFFFFFNYLLDK